MELENLKNIFESLPEGVSIICPDMKIEWVNSSLRGKGFLIENIKGQKCYQVYKKNNKICKGCPAVKAFAQKRVVKQYEKGADGNNYEVTAIPIIKDGSVEAVIEISHEKGLHREIKQCQVLKAEIEKSEKKFRSIAENTTDIVYLANEKGIIEYISPQVSNYGLDKKSIVGKSMDNFMRIALKEDRIKGKRKRDIAVNQAKKTVFSRFRVKDKKGTVYWLEDIGSIRRDSRGNLVGITGIMRDITAGKNVEEELKKNEAWIRGVFSSMDDLVFVFDRSKKFVYHHCPKESSLYISPQFFIGKTVAEVMPESITKKFNIAFAKCSKGSSAEFEYSLGMNSHSMLFHAKMSPILVDGKFEGCVAVIRDVTNVKESCNIIQREKRWSNALIEHAPLIIIGLGQDSKIEVFNRAAEKITGYKAKDVLGKKWIGMFIPKKMQPGIWDVWKEIVKNRKIGHSHINPIITKNGKEKLIHWNNTVIHEKGSFRLVLSIGWEITGKRKLKKPKK